MGSRVFWLVVLVLFHGALGFSQARPKALDDGIRLLEQGQFQKALGVFEEFQNKFPDDPQVFSLLGVSHSALGHYDTAISFFRKATQANPKDFEAYFNLAVTYRKITRTRLALAALKKSVSINPDFADAHYLLGVVYFYEKSESRRARQYFKKAVDLNPSFADAHYGLGLVYLNDGAVEETEREIKILEMLDPPLAKTLGSILANQKK